MPPVESSVRLRIVCGLLFFGTLLIFSRTLANDFISYDDPGYVTKNQQVRAGLDWAGVRWAFGARQSANWHPLTWISHQADWQLFGEHPRGHHATSVGWHALNAVVAFLALRRLTRAFWPSAFCAALFAWHPLRVESVAWVAERKDVLSGFFGLLTLWAYAIYAERRDANERTAWRFYGIALVAFAAGLMAKPMLVTLPCVLLLLDFWPLHRSAASVRAKPSFVAEKIPFFLLSAASAIITYFVQRKGGAMSLAVSMPDRCANAAIAVVRYLGKFFWPFDLAVLYPHPGHWPAAYALGAIALLAAITGLAWRERRRRPWVLTGWLWFLGMLVPVIGLVQVGFQSMADRYTYLPIIGAQIALVWTLYEWFATAAAKRVALVVAAAVLAGCTARTWNQLGTWRNSRTLFEHALAATRDNYVAHNKLGMIAVREHRLAEAKEHFERALALQADDAEVCTNLGNVLGDLGRLAEAIASYERAVRLSPRSADMHANLANAYLRNGQNDLAIASFQQALQLDPDLAPAHGNLSDALARAGRLPEAIAHLQEALRLRPGYAPAELQLAVLLLQVGRTADAIRHCEAAAKLDPDLADAHAMLGQLLSESGELPAAAVQLEAWVRLQPQSAEARNSYGVVLARLGQFADAEKQLAEAIRLRPNYDGAKENLGHVRNLLRAGGRSR